jgi:hypothetical protein
MAAIATARTSVAAWQIIVPIEAMPRAPKSRIKIEFSNVPAYQTRPMPVRATPGLVQVQDVILTVETPNEILADKAVALTAILAESGELLRRAVLPVSSHEFR